ncbi:chemotaxis protein CheA [Plasticicumulans acidivorans]|uniref:Chemotaxis protein CheA n=1 Tax=Plasticicumulans acidivorans TaxID=886464 RepID=A0A317MQL0_9GAMM|nr:chemotaxis protein CheA [Plasticicumulans acidivorans]PWV58749.1 two-component system chemotaxis sensor kinase CheA [Plasticicumulans acidivorans]
MSGMNLEAARQTFIEEARERLQELEAGLLALEHDPQDGEWLNAVFRAAHTIKGSAGLFELDVIVGFTHRVETALDRLRSGEQAFTPALGALLLRAGDHIGLLLDAAVAAQEPDAALLQAGQALLDELARALGEAPPPVPAAAGTLPERVERSGGAALGPEFWHISVRFGREVLRNGMDPLSFIRYLGTLGRLLRVATVTDGLPALADFDAEACYLGFEIDLDSPVDRDTIAGAFEFVADDCTLHILPPRSLAAQYLELLRALPEDDLRIGELLVNSGCLSRVELEQGLRRQAEVQPSPPLGHILVDQHGVEPAVVDEALRRQGQVRERKAASARFLRVQAEHLDALIDQVGELVIAGAAVALLAQKHADTALEEAASTLSRLVAGIRDSALQLRMVPIGETFVRFQRIVRDVAHELGKEITLQISGEETELDKSVVEKIGDPLMHLVRNAIDHGIEPVETRLARGKPASGHLRLDAFHDSGSLVIEVGDDGGGLDRERIRAKAIANGLITADHELDARGLAELIFAPGLSTSDSVTQLSGRGVGMDVVRRNVESLRGSVEVHSTPGAGTVFRIRLPLTLAIIDGFLLGCSGSRFVVPLDSVVECVELDTAGAGVCPPYLNLRQHALPLVCLRELFGLPAGGGARRASVVVVQCGGRRAGIVVDELFGEFQTVIKPLGPLFAPLRAISGSTILGSGEVALIIDIAALVQLAAQRRPVLPSRSPA